MSAHRHCALAASLLLHLLALAWMLLGGPSSAAPARAAASASALIASVWLYPRLEPPPPPTPPVEHTEKHSQRRPSTPAQQSADAQPRPGPAPLEKNAAEALVARAPLTPLTPVVQQASQSPSASTANAPEAAPLYQAARPPERACTEQQLARHYPPLLRERGIEGQVLLRVRVDEQGHAAEVQVQGGSGWRLLDEAALRLAQGCPYVPARRGGQALSAWVEYPVRFALSAPAPRSE